MGPGGRPHLFWVKKEKSQKEEKPEGQAQSFPLTLAQGLDSPLVVS